ncbi:MAG: hypothetical protein MH825_08105 [Cyanobacteria bacterium]|nr:hypothetical protein [Cyanobacteriota bacterium]
MSELPLSVAGWSSDVDGVLIPASALTQVGLSTTNFDNLDCVVAAIIKMLQPIYPESIRETNDQVSVTLTEPSKGTDSTINSEGVTVNWDTVNIGISFYTPQSIPSITPDSYAP